MQPTANSTTAELIDRALVIAKHVARARARRPIQVDDLFSAGNAAAWEAARSWTGEGDFSAFARTVITRRVCDELRKIIGRGDKSVVSKRVGLDLAESELGRSVSRRQSPTSTKWPRKPTKRQEQVWKMLTAGLRVGQIAMLLNTSSSYIDRCISRLRKNLAEPPDAPIGRLQELYQKKKKIRWERDGERLTPRQRLVWKSAADGLSNKEIAAATGLSKNNVAGVIWHLKRRVGAESKEALVRYWEKLVR